MSVKRLNSCWIVEGKPRIRKNRKRLYLKTADDEENVSILIHDGRKWQEWGATVNYGNDHFHKRLVDAREAAIKNFLIDWFIDE